MAVKRLSEFKILRVMLMVVFHLLQAVSSCINLSTVSALEMKMLILIMSLSAINVFFTGVNLSFSFG